MASTLLYITPLLLSIAAVLWGARALEMAAIFLAGFILLFRHGVGYDYHNYVFIFENDISFFTAPLADLLQDLARTLAVPNGFMGLVAILTTSLLLYLSRSDASPRLSVLMFLAFPLFFLDSFTIVRQVLAVMLIALSYQMLRQKYTVKTIIAYLIAIGIHPSAAISLPLFFIVERKFSWKYLLIFLPSFGLLYIVSNIFINSNLYVLYQQEDISGNYYLVVAGAALIVALYLKRRNLIILSILGFAIALTMYVLSNYVLNRILVFLYVPFLFIPLHVRGERLQVNTLLLIVFFCILYFAAYSVKLKDTGNGFIPYDTIF
jgi:hypothetical protein